MNIIFMGSPSFALPALSALINSEHNLLAIYTQPPQPAGRGHKLQYTPVHQLAEQHNLLVKTPVNFKAAETIRDYESLAPDITVVVAYGIILPRKIIDIPKYGAINIHPSDLPKYRGAAPLQRTIMGDEKTTAVCIIRMDTGIDTGEILASQKLSLADDINFSQLHDQTAVIGSKLLLDTINSFSSVKPISQSSDGASYAHKVTKEEAMINWQTDDGQLIDRKLRAFNPAPGTYFLHNNKIIKLKSAHFIAATHQYQPGSIIDSKFTIACIGGFIKPIILQREGKRPMLLEEFLLGYEVLRTLQ